MMRLRYLLDTNICIYIAKQKPERVLHKFEKLTTNEVGMSLITYGELNYGAQKSHFPKKALQTLDELITFIPPLFPSIETGHYYGEIRNHLAKKGKIIGNNDLWIAAHALALNVILVTNNIKEFSRISTLHLENWVDS